MTTKVKSSGLGNNIITTSHLHTNFDLDSSNIAANAIGPSELNLTKNYTFTGTVAGAGDAILKGSIVAYAGSSVPTGYLSCDGSAVSRSTYADLYSAIGTTWGAGDGSSTFNVPDLRAMFLRGTGTHGTANMAKGTDFSAPAVGTIENDQMQDHKHETIMSPGTSYQGYSSYAIGNHAYSTTYNFTTTAPLEINSQGTPRTGDETRPVNAAVLYIIKT
jgi:microcystin-dependent protein